MWLSNDLSVLTEKMLEQERRLLGLDSENKESKISKNEKD